MNYEELMAVRCSELKELRKSPLHYKERVCNGSEDTTALRLGRIFHTAILEFDKWDERYAVAPAVDRRTKAGKEAYNLFLEQIEQEGKEAISAEERDQAQLMREAVLYDPYASRYLKEFRPEQIYCWTDPETGIACKMKADAVTVVDGNVVLIDYKTTDSCAGNNFEYSVKKYGYQLQAGMYCEGYFANSYTMPKFVFIAQEKKPPYACRVYECDPYFIEQGRAEFHRLLQILKHCEEEDKWPGYYPTQLLGE
ncbi:MAG: PD-(D/E)XK nuclease-like domain-containing protein [Firmicutes bacterium]|nr:PD-(D/E)XK nuclease-like domain-containing protein [Bacillota bacterium]